MEYSVEKKFIEDSQQMKLIADTRRGLLDYLDENLPEGRIREIFWDWMERATAEAEKDSM